MSVLSVYVYILKKHLHYNIKIYIFIHYIIAIEGSMLYEKFGKGHEEDFFSNVTRKAFWVKLKLKFFM